MNSGSSSAQPQIVPTPTPASPSSAPMQLASTTTIATATTKTANSDEKIRFVDLSNRQKAPQVEKITIQQFNERIKTRPKDSKMHIRFGNFSKPEEAPLIKEITVDELNKMAGTQVKWSDTHIEVADAKSRHRLSEADLKLYPEISKEKFDAIMTKVKESSKKLALARPNSVHGFSTITTQDVEPGELTLIYVGKYSTVSAERKSDYNLIMGAQFDTEVDATEHRGYFTYALDAPLPSTLPANIAGRESLYEMAYSISDYECKEPENNIVTMNILANAIDNFSFEGVPYKIYKNIAHIPAFNFLATNYGKDFFMLRETTPRLCLKNGMLLPDDHFKFYYIKANIEGDTICFGFDREKLDNLVENDNPIAISASDGGTYLISVNRFKQVMAEMSVGEENTDTRKHFYTLKITDFVYSPPDCHFSTSGNSLFGFFHNSPYNLNDNQAAQAAGTLSSSGPAIHAPAIPALKFGAG